jgi:hypothetical protein
MPDPREEDDIFESANLPAEQEQPPDREVAVPDSHADELVSSMISSLQREQGGPAARRYLPAQVPSEPRQQPPQQQPGHQQDPGMQGVIAELREERRARQELAREIQELRQPRQPEAPFSQRVFEDPDNAIDGRVRQHIDPIAQRLQNALMDVDFRLAETKYGTEKFGKAYSDWFAQVADPSRPDPQTYFAIMNAASPGEAVMRWHRSQRVNTEVPDGDLDAYRARIERETLERHGLVPPQEETRGRSSNGNGGEPGRAANGQFTPRHEVRLPTPTSRMGHTSRESAFQPEDGSDEAIFEFGREKPSRR